MVKTVLGSCVSVCLFDKRLKTGGISHFLLPQWKGKGLATPRYGNVAINLLYKKMIGAGSSSSDLVSKIFGGAKLVNTGPLSSHPGILNVKAAKRYLKLLNIDIVSEDTGGHNGRILIFNPPTGTVWVKKN